MYKVTPNPPNDPNLKLDQADAEREKLAL